MFFKKIIFKNVIIIGVNLKKWGYYLGVGIIYFVKFYKYIEYLF